MSRTAAKGRFVKVGGKRIRTEGLVRHDEMMKWIQDRGIELRGGDLDEAPQAYKDVEIVMQSQKQLIDILGKFYPKIVKMDSGSSRPWREKKGVPGE